MYVDRLTSPFWQLVWERVRERESEREKERKTLAAINKKKSGECEKREWYEYTCKNARERERQGEIRATYFCKIRTKRAATKEIWKKFYLWDSPS